MQDDCYLISADGWITGARPRELVQVKNRDGKLVWPETEDFRKGRRRFKSDLVPRTVMIARYFVAERGAIEAIEGELAAIEQQLDEAREEQGGEDGLLSEVIEGEGEKQKITAKAIKARLKEIGKDPDYADERPGAGGVPGAARQPGCHEEAAEGGGGRAGSEAGGEISRADRGRDQDAGGG